MKQQQLSDRQEHAQGRGDDDDDVVAMATPSRKFNSVDAKMVNMRERERGKQMIDVSIYSLVFQ